MRRYKIICLDCGEEREIGVHHTALGDRIDWLETPQTLNAAIVSGRKRPDGNWGFQCACGNDDLMTRQELEYYSNLTSPKAEEINAVMTNLEVQKPNFEMVGA